MKETIIKGLIKEELDQFNQVERRKVYKEYIQKLLLFIRDELNLRGKIRVVLTKNHSKLVTTASYNLQSKTIMIYEKNRALVDLLKSISHEAVHQKQDEEGRIKNISDGDDGSGIENEANAKAGEIIRKMGKKYPEIYRL